jgi:prepilin-type N-terminal cleavage/methylation domain-containing protein/prepilin-type processing-associated H-X9-DG protein
MSAPRSPRDSGFSLVELLVVVAIITVLIGILLPALSRARATALRVQCLANMRTLAMAQAMYAVANHNALVDASDLGSFDISQGSWIGALQPYSAIPLARRCPADRSPYFDQPLVLDGVPGYRSCSYAINNYVSPTHAPTGLVPYQKITQVRHTSETIQFVELVETGNNALADHVHVDGFYSPLSPIITLNKISAEMAVGRHDGRVHRWDALLNYSFLDGHAEGLRLRDVYVDPNHNKFDPTVAK